MDRSKLKYIEFPIERDCFGCSPTNPISLKLEFYSDPESQKLYSFFTPTSQYVSWGNITHGGISATVLDEMSAWVVIMTKKLMCVTSSFELKYYAPLVIDNEYIITGQIASEKGRAVIVSSEIIDDSGKLYVSATTKLVTLSHTRAKSMKIMNETDFDAMLEFFNQ
jgi:acyl-coenzyme A thioesterase PaaI-like protein